jgi:hypothetical protein
VFSKGGQKGGACALFVGAGPVAGGRVLVAYQAGRVGQKDHDHRRVGGGAVGTAAVPPPAYARDHQDFLFRAGADGAGGRSAVAALEPVHFPHRVACRAPGRA